MVEPSIDTRVEWVQFPPGLPHHSGRAGEKLEFSRPTPPPKKKKRRRRARFRLDPTGPFPFLLNMAFQLLCALLRRCGTARGVKGCCSFGLSHISSCMWEQTLPILIVRPREGITSCDGTGFLLLRSSTDSSPKASGGRTLPWGESAPSPQLQKRRVGSFWTPIGEELLIRAQPEKAGLGKKKKGPVGSERCTPRRLWRFEFGVQRLGENIVEPTAADRSRPQPTAVKVDRKGRAGGAYTAKWQNSGGA
jgi:hypothetical protein